MQPSKVPTTPTATDPELSCACCRQGHQIHFPILKSLHWLKINERTVYSLFIWCHSCSTIHPLYSKNYWSLFPTCITSSLESTSWLFSSAWTSSISSCTIHHFFLITSAYQFQHHHSLLPSSLHFFILASKPFFSINPTLHRPLVPFGLISRITWLFIGLLCSTVLLFSVFSNFSFQNLFPLQLFFSSSLLYLLLFSPSFFSFGESYWFSWFFLSFFQFFVFHKLLVLMR